MREAFAAMMAGGPPPSGVTLTFAGWLVEADAALDRASRFILDRLAPVPAVR